MAQTNLRLMVTPFYTKLKNTQNLLKIAFLFLIATLLMPACTSKTLYPEIISKYANGMPHKVNYYEYQGNTKIKRKVVRLFPDGDEEEVTNFNTQGLKHGLYLLKHPTANNWIEENYVNGIRHGNVKVWYMSGSIEYKGIYANGLPNGKWTFFYPNGSKQKTVVYENGE